MSTSSTVSTFIPSDLVRYLIHRKLAVFDDIGLRLNLPASVTTTITHGPPAGSSNAYLFYYLSFGDTPVDGFNIKCVHSPSCLTHECAPCGEEVINIGCPFWSFLTTRDPFKMVVTNATLSAKILKLRFWQLRMSERDIPEVNGVINTFCGNSQAQLLEKILNELQKRKM